MSGLLGTTWVSRRIRTELPDAQLAASGEPDEDVAGEVADELGGAPGARSTRSSSRSPRPAAGRAGAPPSP